MKVTVLGCGRWGAFLAWYAAKIGHDVTLWGRPGSQNLAQLWQDRMNEYLRLPDTVELSDQLDSAVQAADFIIISISAQNLRSFLPQLMAAGAHPQRQRCVLCMKGIEVETGKRLSEVFCEETGCEEVGIWVGPGHVQSFVQGVPNCMVVDAKEIALQNEIIDAFGSSLIRFYYGTDLIGTEIGAASKNVVGLAAGMLDGLELTALKGALMARAPREIARLICALGGKEQSAYSLAHLGDYEATLFSLHSHNRRYGEDFVRGKNFGKLAEGVSTTEALCALGATYNVELPICDCVHRVIQEGEDPMKQLDGLFSRPIKREFL